MRFPFHHRSLLALTALTLVPATVACSARPQAAEAPAQPPADAAFAASDKEHQEQVMTLDQAALHFERAEVRVREAFAKPGRHAATPAGETAAGGQQPPPAPRPQTVDDPEEEGEEIALAEARNRCTVACRALESMQRSAERLCELTGEDDPRCENMLERVRRARETVYRSCPQCEAARPER